MSRKLDIWKHTTAFLVRDEPLSEVQTPSTTLPNQPHLNKYQINIWFSHFHEFGILYGIYILAAYQIDIVKEYGFCNGSIIFIWHWFFFQQIMILEDENNIDILFFTRHCQGIDNCFYAFDNTRNTPKFEPFHIEHQPTQIR